MFIADSFLRVLNTCWWPCEEFPSLYGWYIYLCIYCQSVTALTLSVYHFTTVVITIVLPLSWLFVSLWSLSLFPILYWQTQSHSHFPFDKSWPALQRLYTTLHFFYSFVKFPCDQSSDCFYANPLDRAITTVACFPMILWYICNIFGFFETFVFTTPISAYILQTSCFQSHVRDGFSLWAGVWQWFHSRG